MHWLFFTSIVVFGATGIHFFSKLAKGTMDPFVGLVYTTGAAFMFALLFLPMAQGDLARSFSTYNKGVVFYALVGLCITIAHIGIFLMFRADAPMSIATPLARFVPAILAVFLGVFFFHESLKLTQILGLVLAVIAVFLVTKPAWFML